MQELVDAGLVESLQDTTNVCYWKVQLSNGATVVQDDSNGSAWIKLAQYLQKYPKVYILKFGVHCGDNSYYTPENQNSYYFSKGLVQAATASEAVHYYVMGWQPNENACLECMWIKIPELLPINHYQKIVKECYGPALIFNGSP